MRTFEPGAGTAPPSHVAPSDQGPLFADLTTSTGNRAPMTSRARIASLVGMGLPPPLPTNTARRPNRFLWASFSAGGRDPLLFCPLLAARCSLLLRLPSVPI